ncbi:MAG: helix-turn-helix transcriptional regulator [Vicinamibacteraceae bacterium]
MSDRLLTIFQTAEQFNVTRQLLYGAVARGDLAAVRFSARGRIRLREDDVSAWIEGHRAAARNATSASLTPVTAPDGAGSPRSQIEHLLPPLESRRFAS